LCQFFLTGFADLIISGLTQSRTDSLMRRLPNGQLLFAMTISLSLRSRLPWVRLKLYQQPENRIGFGEGASGGSALAQF
jgi:hypothetical protein